jgi:hypothetical protein
VAAQEATRHLVESFFDLDVIAAAGAKKLQEAPEVSRHHSHNFLVCWSNNSGTRLPVPPATGGEITYLY